MSKLNLLLLVALLLSCLVQVRTAYESRRLFAELDVPQPPGLGGTADAPGSIRRYS